MDVSEIVNKFRSRDSHKIWEATWEILRCNDRDQLLELKNHIPFLSEMLSEVKMGEDHYSITGLKRFFKC